MVSQSKPQGKRKGNKLLIAVVCIGLVLLVFGSLWLGVIWPKMTMLPVHMDEYYWQQGYFEISDLLMTGQDTGNFTKLAVKDEIHAWSNLTLGDSVFFHVHHQFYDNSTGAMLPFAKEQILPLNRKTGLINPALMQYPVGQAAAGYSSFPGGLKEGMTVNVFCPGTNNIRLATFVRNDVYHFKDRDIKVVVMRQEYTDVPTSVPGLPPGVTITGYSDYFVEQKTGIGLDVYADEAISMPVQGKNTVIFKDQIWYDPSMTEDMLDTVDTINTMFPIMGTILPWLCIGLGIVCMLGGGSVLLIKARKKVVA